MNDVARLEALGRPHECAPSPLPEILVQGRVNRNVVAVAARRPLAEKLRGDHLCVVGDQQIAGTKQRGQISDYPVFNAFPPDVKQTRGVAGMRRMKRNPFLRQFKIEKVDAHHRTLVLRRARRSD